MSGAGPSWDVDRQEKEVIEDEADTDLSRLVQLDEAAVGDTEGEGESGRCEYSCRVSMFDATIEAQTEVARLIRGIWLRIRW